MYVKFYNCLQLSMIFMKKVLNNLQSFIENLLRFYSSFSKCSFSMICFLLHYFLFSFHQIKFSLKNFKKKHTRHFLYNTSSHSSLVILSADPYISYWLVIGWLKVTATRRWSVLFWSVNSVKCVVGRCIKKNPFYRHP